MALQDINLFAS